MSAPAKAVFLSYASQDAEAAKKICDTLRADGVEVWFDQEGGLEHGDEWDTKIRRQIKECVLFIPVISANTQAREEGYFRIEWELAAQRALGIASGVAFILPVVIDDTREPDALVPDRFRAVQWTRLRGGEVLPDVKQRFLKLWSHRAGVVAHQAAKTSEPDEKIYPAPVSARDAVGKPVAKTYALMAAAILALVAVVGWWFLRGPTTKNPASTAAVTSVATAPSLSEAAKLAEEAGKHYWDIFTRDDLVLAEELGRRATDLDPQLARAWAVRAGANASYLLRGFANGAAAQARARDAQSFANRALALDKNDVEALLALGLVADDQNATGQAEAFYRRVLALDPSNNHAPRFLSIVLRRTGRVPEAVALMKDAARRFPHDALTHFDLALGYAQGWNFTKAWEECEVTQAAQPFPGARVAQAWIVFQWKGDIAQMRALLDGIDVAYRGDDEAVAVDLMCGLLERRTDHVLEAAGRTTSVYFEEQRVPKAWFTAQAYELDGKQNLARQQWQAAEAVLRERLRVEPQNMILRLTLDDTLTRLGQIEEARADFESIEAAWREQMSASRAQSLARFYAATGEAAKAVSWLRQALNRGAGIDALRPYTLQLDPWWDKIRDSPEFQALLANPLPPPAPVDEPAAPGASAPATQPDQKSVAVLAFTNLSDDKDNEYFSDGISEELLTVLQKIPGLHVAARTSAFSFKGKNATAQEIGEKLGVVHLVEGSVQKSGKRVKITARLTRVATGEELWSKSFPPLELTDVFATQSEIAQAIVGELRGHLGGAAAANAKAEIQAQVQAAEKGGTKNAEAHQLYLQGKFFLNQFSRENIDRSAANFRRAVAFDPSFALAWAALAEALATQGAYGLTDRPLAEIFQEARQVAERALALEPNFAEGHAALMAVQLRYDLDWRAAAASAHRALELAPSDATMLSNAATSVIVFEQFERAIELARQAVALDPLNVSARRNLAGIYWRSGRLKEAETECRRILEFNPAALAVNLTLCAVVLLDGRVDEAGEIIEHEKERWARNTGLAVVRWAQKRIPDADAALKELVERDADTAALQIAAICAYRGDADQAFAWLERAYRQHDAGLSIARQDQFIASLRHDPRWPVFLKKVGLADEQLK